MRYNELLQFFFYENLHVLEIREQSLFMAEVENEEKWFFTLKKVLANQFEDHLFITQPISDTTVLIPNTGLTNISDL